MKNLTLLLFLAAQASAQKLTLPDAIAIALQKNFAIQIAQNDAEISRINNHLGIAGGLPSVTAAASDQQNASNINQKLNTGAEIRRDGAAVNTLNANVTGTMMLYDGHRVRATHQRLGERQKQSELLLAAQIQNTVAGVEARYFGVVRQQRYIETLQESVRLSDKQLEIVRAKQAVGLANDADVFQSEIDLNTRKQALQAQQLALAQAKTDLLILLDVSPDSAIVVADSIVLEKNIQLATVLAGLRQNPEITALDQQINIQALLEKETAALRSPTVRANAGLVYGRTQANGGQFLLNQSYGPFGNVGVSVPIYSGGVFGRQEQMAKIATRNAQLQKENALLDAQANALKTFQAYASSLQQLETQQSTVQLSAKLVSLSLQRFQLAAATIVELREAQKSFEEASFRLVDLSFSAKMAEIELKRLGGTLGF